MKPVKAYKQCNRYAQAFIHILLFSLKTRFLNIVYHLYFKIAEESRNIYFLQQTQFYRRLSQNKIETMCSFKLQQ